MNLIRIMAVASLAALAVACKQTSAPQPPAPAAQDAPAQAQADASPSAVPTLDAALATSRPVAIAVEGTNEAVFLTDGEGLTYQLGAPEDGVLNGVGVQIGNFGGTSDGQLGVRVCQEEQCSEGSAPLAGSVDNASLAVALQTPLQVTQGPLEVRVSRTGGFNPFAVWAYPSDGSMTRQDGSDTKSTLNTVLFYKIR